MIELLEQHREELAGLCRKYCVARLDLFGSAATGKFDPTSSDLDFLVEFDANCPVGPFSQYFDFLLDLERLFGCKVDLVETNAMKNRFFIESANRDKVRLYAA